MNQMIVQSHAGVTLVGGGPLGARDMALARRRAPLVVAADGGADRVLAQGLMPAAVIGDFDSISPQARAAIPPDRLHLIAEQDTTDFDKALSRIAAPFVLALGFAGARMDHALAVLNGLARNPARVCVVIGPADLAFLCPPTLRIALPPGSRFSLFPLGPVRGQSRGLRWPLDGLLLAPDGMTATSNAVAAPQVELSLDGPLLGILPRAALDAVITAMVPGWHRPHRTAAM